ncbi:MAG: DUF1826 domain-containing protein [Planctomycetota bacterium]
MQPTPSAAAASGTCARQSDQVTELAGIHDADVQMAIWHRPVDSVLRRFAANVLAARPVQQVLEVEVAELDRFDPLPASLHAAEPVAAELFAADVRWLAGMFAELVGASRLGVRLMRLEQAMCPRFHTDFVGVRLLTTYCGTGTEWLEDRDVDRRFLGHRSMDVPDDRSGLLRPGAAVQVVPEFAVALLKGEAWPGNLERGLVHRSPALAGTRRVLLSIDVLDQAHGHHGFDTSGHGRPAPHDDCGPDCGGAR